MQKYAMSTYAVVPVDILVHTLTHIGRVGSNTYGLVLCILAGVDKMQRIGQPRLYTISCCVIYTPFIGI